jgi:hypothetical protein
MSMVDSYGNITSYGKIHNLGGRATALLFHGPVVIEEKVDGSQLSFGVFSGKIVIRSKNQVLTPGAQSMFAEAERSIAERAHLLRPGLTYRGEYLRKPRHNVLTYGRVPKGHVVIFEAMGTNFAPPARRAKLAADADFESVPVLYEGEIGSANELERFLDRESFLGGKIEGVVIKNYAFSSENGYGPLMGKYVSSAFRELNKTSPARKVPGKEIRDELAVRFCTEARWQKAVQRLRESGELQGETRDIGALIRTVSQDLEEECADEIMDALYQWARKRVLASATRGLADWYREQLAKAQFD